MTWWSRAVAEELRMRQKRQDLLQLRSLVRRGLSWSCNNRDIDVVIVGGGHAGTISGNFSKTSSTIWPCSVNSALSAYDASCLETVD